MKTEYIYTIARGYQSCTVWGCNNKTRRRQGTLRLTPNKGLTRKARYAEIYRFLKPMVPVPPYVPNKAMSTKPPEGYWVCACIKRDAKGALKAIKYNPPSRKRCRVCNCTPLPDKPTPRTP